jgi:hemoglobin
MAVYDDIGGKEAVAATVERFYDNVLADPELAPFFVGTDIVRQKAHMRAFIAAALGGPQLYEGRDMRSAHAGAHITHHAFDRVVGHLVATLTSLAIPPHIIEAIGGRIAPLRSEVVGA